MHVLRRPIETAGQSGHFLRSKMVGHVATAYCVLRI